MLRKTNQPEAEKELFNANKEKLMKSQQIEHVKSAETKFNERIRFIKRSSMSADLKREKINQINIQRERVAQLVAPGFNRLPGTFIDPSLGFTFSVGVNYR